MTKSENDSIITAFFKMEAAGGILLMIATLLALIAANSGLQPYYDLILNTQFEIRLGTLALGKPLLLWINDGLMAIFFFVVGLELKRELLEGELSDKSNIILPGVGAVGGMLVPAIIYLLFNFNDAEARAGWAIPAATDIAFALGVLSLLGSRVPVSLKVFLTSLAIFDDIGAIIIIAVFYTAQISFEALVVASFCIPLLLFLNSSNVTTKTPYLVLGAILWVAMLKSGVHATLAGVLLAMFIPMSSKKDPQISPLKSMEHELHSVVAFWVLPIFAFANAGIDFGGITSEQIIHGVPIGIALGLFLGKQIGVFGFCWLFIKMGLTRLPHGMSWASLYGTATLCGIGFTMSLFIGSLAFEESGVDIFFDERVGILLGSLISGVVGYLILNRSLSKS